MEIERCIFAPLLARIAATCPMRLARPCQGLLLVAAVTTTSSPRHASFSAATTSRMNFIQCLQTVMRVNSFGLQCVMLLQFERKWAC